MPDGTKKRVRRRIILVKVVKKAKPETVEEDPNEPEEIEIDEENPEDEKYDPNVCFIVLFCYSSFQQGSIIFDIKYHFIISSTMTQ